MVDIRLAEGLNRPDVRERFGETYVRRGWHASPLVFHSMRRARRLNGLQIGDRELPEDNGLLRPLA